MQTESFMWRIFPKRFDMTYGSKEIVFTETEINGIPVMRTKNQELIVIISGIDSESTSWSSSCKDRKMKQYLSTHPDLVRIVIDFYQSGVLDIDKLFTTIKNYNPDFTLNDNVEFYCKRNGLRLDFIPKDSKYRIMHGEYVLLYKEDEFFSS